jgi:hypothetical protein
METKSQQPKQPEKGKDQRLLGERYGKKASHPLLHPVEKETGRRGASNVGEDESSGSE